MPNPTIPNFPPQGIQAQLDLLYLYNPDAANELIAQMQAGLIELNELKVQIEKALQDMQGVLRYKGSVETRDDLPTSGNVVGDIWNIVETNENVSWNGNEWVPFGSSIDTSSFAKITWVTDNFINADASTYTLASLRDPFNYSNARLYKIFNEGKMPTRDTYTLLSLGWTYNDSNNIPTLVASNVATGKFYYYHGSYADCTPEAWQAFTFDGGELSQQVAKIAAAIPDSAGPLNLLITENDLMEHTELPAQPGNAGKVLSTNGVTPIWADTANSVNGKTGAVVLTGDDIESTVGSETAYITEHLETIKETEAASAEKIEEINELIPEAASATNKLATAADITNAAEGLSAETARAEAAEAELSNRITANGTAIADEVTRAKTAEGAIDSKVATNTTAIAANQTSIAAEKSRAETAESGLDSKINNIQDIIPSTASTTNELADKAFVNSTIQTATANFRGNWADWAAVPTVDTGYPEDYANSRVPTVNDYLVVANASDYSMGELNGTWRFKYTGTWSEDGKDSWLPEYQVNEEPLTMAQLAALNSGITAQELTDLKDGVAANEEKITEVESALQTGLDGKANTADVEALTESVNALTITVGGKANASDVEAGLAEKVNIDQGIENAGKILKVGQDGNVTLDTTADFTQVEHDTSLSGQGTTASPLGVANPLPSQTGHTGFLKTDGTEIEWSDKAPLLNNSTAENGLAIGEGARATGENSIQIGAGTNSTPNSMKVNDWDLLDTSNGIIPSERLASDGTEGQVLTKTATGTEWTTVQTPETSDNNGLEGDYATAYGIVDETKSGLPYIKSVGSRTVVVPGGLVLDVPGQSGLTTVLSPIEYEVQSTNNPQLFLAQGTVIEATDIFWQEEEPDNGTEAYAAWWNGTTWQFKSNDTGNVWRAANAVRLAKTVFTGSSLTRLCFTGCRVLNKQEYISKDTQTLNIEDEDGNRFSYNGGKLLIYSDTAANPVGEIGAQGSPLKSVYTQQINGINVPDAPATGETPTFMTAVAHDTTLAGDGTTASPLKVGAGIQNEISTLNSNIDYIYEELGEKLDSSSAASTYAAKASDFITPISNTNKGATKTEIDELDNKIDIAGTSGKIIGSYWFGKTNATSEVPAPTLAGQNYYDFATGQVYKSEDGSTWTLVGTNIPPADIDAQIIISSKFWDIPEQENQHGGKAWWSHTNQDWSYSPTIYQDKPAGGASLPMLARLTSTAKFNNVSYLNANTFSWQDGSMYLAAYQHLVDDLSTAGAVQTVTIEGMTISYEVATDGHRICLADQESAVSQLYAKTGEADFYILDTENARFKLPRTQKRKLIRAVKNPDGSWYNLYSDGWVEQGGVSNTGQLLDQQKHFIVNLPIALQTGYTLTAAPKFNSGTPAAVVAVFRDTQSPQIILQKVQSGGVLDSGVIWIAQGYAVDTFLANEPVQYEYYYVGNFEQSAIAQTAGINAEMFNAKADVDLQNVSNAGKSACANWGMPSNSYIDLTLGPSGTTYTAPAAGYYYIWFENSALIEHWVNISINGTLIGNYWAQVQNNSFAVPPYPVKSGDVLKLEYGSDIKRAILFRFYYAEGAKPNS